MSVTAKQKLLLQKLVECFRKAESVLEDEACSKIFQQNMHLLSSLPEHIKLGLLQVLPRSLDGYVCSHPDYSEICYKDKEWSREIKRKFGMNINDPNPGRNYSIFKEIYALKRKYVRVYKLRKGMFRKEWTKEDFDFVRKLGSGGYGDVFLATAKGHSNLPVVVKFINRESLRSKSSDPNLAEEMLRQEINNQALSKSPHVAEIYAAFIDDENYYIVMEYCSEPDIMDQLIKLSNKKKYLPLEKVREIILQMARALAFVHSRGITHRDVKAENVLDCGNGTYKLTDFGLSCNEKVMYKFTGTADYVSPEMLKGEGYDIRTDIWSLGVLGYIILYSRFPFAGKDHNEIYDKILNNPVRFPKISTREDKNAKDLIKRLLTKDPERRITLKDVITHPFVTFGEAPKKRKSNKKPPQPSEVPEWMTPPKKESLEEDRVYLEYPEWMTPPKKPILKSPEIPGFMTPPKKKTKKVRFDFETPEK